MVKREYDAKRINKIVNNPEVSRWVRGSYPNDYIDISPLIADRRNICLTDELGGVVFVQHQMGLYDAHVQVLPEGRGQWALHMVQEALKWVFTRTEAVEITTRVPKGNLGARALVRSIHGRSEFRLDPGWVVNGNPVYADVYSLTIQEWFKTAPGLTEKGQWFHSKLESEMAKRGKSEPQHPEDPVHDRYVGAAVEMILGGQPGKAVVMYNRWAAITGYAQIKIVTESPLVLDVSNALLIIKDKDFWCL